MIIWSEHIVFSQRKPKAKSPKVEMGRKILILRAKRNVPLYEVNIPYFLRENPKKTQRKKNLQKMEEEGRKERERRSKGGERERGGGYKEKEYHEKLEEKTVYMIDGFLFFSDILSSENVILFEKF